MDKQTLKNCDLVFAKTVTQWDEAIPLGNGQSGALIWGGPRQLRFSLDRVDIWDETIPEGVFQDQFSYADLTRLAREGRIEEIRRIYREPCELLLPTKLPAGKLLLDFDRDGNVESRLSLEAAIAEIRIGEDITLHSFLHATERVGMLRCTGSFQWNHRNQ